MTSQFKLVAVSLLAFGLTAHAHGRYRHRRHHDDAQTRPSHQLSATACAHIQSRLDAYTSRLENWAAHRPRIKSLAERQIQHAQDFVNRVCPPQAPTPYECTVANQDFSLAVSLGVDSSGNLVNVITPDKTVCMTQNACQTIASQAFSVFSASSSSRCADSTDATVVHLSDSQMQTKVNAVLEK